VCLCAVKPFFSNAEVIEAEAEAALPPRNRSSSSSASTASVSDRYSQWRASFSVKLYSMLESPLFPQLERALLHVCLSTLRTLQPRFWHADNLELFIDVLALVRRGKWGKNIVSGALKDWLVTDINAGAQGSAEQRRQVCAEFSDRIKAHLGAKTTQQQLQILNQRKLMTKEENDRLKPTAVACDLSLSASTRDAQVQEEEEKEAAAAAEAAEVSASPSSALHSAALFSASQSSVWEQQVDVLNMDVIRQQRSSSTRRALLPAAEVRTMFTTTERAPHTSPRSSSHRVARSSPEKERLPRSNPEHTHKEAQQRQKSSPAKKRKVSPSPSPSPVSKASSSSSSALSAAAAVPATPTVFSRRTKKRRTETEAEPSTITTARPHLEEDKEKG
jgi:hypothetical protein